MGTWEWDFGRRTSEIDWKRFSVIETGQLAIFGIDCHITCTEVHREPESFSFRILSCRPAWTLEKLIVILTREHERTNSRIYFSDWFTLVFPVQGAWRPGETPAYVHPSLDETRDSSRYMGIWKMHPGSQSVWHMFILYKYWYYGSGTQPISYVVRSFLQKVLRTPYRKLFTRTHCLGAKPLEIIGSTPKAASCGDSHF